MGQQLVTKEAFDTIAQAIKHAGENLTVNLSHIHTSAGNQSFFVEIEDEDQVKKISDWKKTNPLRSEMIFSLNIPYEYFNSDTLPIDDILGIKTYDDVEVKAEIRCIDLITKTYLRWLKDHKIFVGKDLIPYVNKALDKLRTICNISLRVRGDKGEVAEKYIVLWLTEDHVSRLGQKPDNGFFSVEFHIYDYELDVGAHAEDAKIGLQNLRGKSKDDICLLRVAHILYREFTGWLNNNFPNLYADFTGGKW